jgi:hypothetical protein
MIGFVSSERQTMVSRRRLLMVMAAVAASMCAPAHAQQNFQIARDSPGRKPILDAVRASIESTLGIKVVFVVDRMTMAGDWAFASLHPRDAAGHRIDYRRTRIAKDFDPEQDSDLVGALVRRQGASWSLVEHALLPTDVYWDQIQIAARAVFERE